MRARARRAATVGLHRVLGVGAVVGSVVAVGSVIAAVGVTIGGCGASPPRDEDVYHEASLRPGSVPAASDAERQLLAGLSTLVANQPVRLGDRTFVPLDSYTSATGRRCTPIREAGTARTRVACEERDAWVFVPDVFGGDDPFDGASTAGTP